MSVEKAQKIRAMAATWRALLGDVLARQPLVLDPKNHTALQHGAQVKENIAVVLPQLQEAIKGETSSQVTFPLSKLLTESAITDNAEVNALSYHLADNLGQIADIVERSASSASATSGKEEQLLSLLLEDIRERAVLIEQSYEAFRQQQAQQQ